MGCGITYGNGAIVEQPRATGDFSGVRVGHGFHANVIIGPETSVKIRGDENLLDDISLEVRSHGVLTVDPDFSWGFSPSEPILLTIMTPTLRLVDTSGGVRATVSGLQDGDFTLEASGGSRVVLFGFTPQLDMEASGGSQVQALGLTAESATIDASGGSKASVAVIERVLAEASGGSTIVVHGNPPQRETRTSGGGQVLFE
jgi:hypothetical protein